jgi:acyl-coenzyme A synthetase/AMP-(fatty) acid ligase
MSEPGSALPPDGTVSTSGVTAGNGVNVTTGHWVDRELLAGADDDVCLYLGAPTTRSELRSLVAAQQELLSTAGLRPGGTVTLILPPSLGYVTSLLASWRIGAQVSLLDHRLARPEIDKALDQLAPQVVVEPKEITARFMAGYATVDAVPAPRPGGAPAGTAHALIQLSSGSTGPSKVIARTSDDLIFELGRYEKLADYPGGGTRIVLLASIVHVLGLVGGLLHSLHAGLELVFPDRLTADGIRGAVTAGDEPTMLLGVPFHAELLTADPRPLPQLTKMVVAGELTRPWVRPAFTAGYGVPLGNMYGMTELGVIATDLLGQLAPAVAAAPGMRLRVVDGELRVAMPATPYIGLIDETRWVDGWLHTRDAAAMDDAGHVTILGRLDSQVSIGGLKVDLTEVEQTIGGLPEVTACVVSYDDAIEAYLVLAEGAELADVGAAITEQLAAYKRPRRMHVLSELPRTATGKNVRDRKVLQAAATNAKPTVSP